MVKIKKRSRIWGKPKTREDMERRGIIDMPGYTGEFRKEAYGDGGPLEYLARKRK
jgi:hypothetical protein